MNTFAKKGEGSQLKKNMSPSKKQALSKNYVDINAESETGAIENILNDSGAVYATAVVSAKGYYNNIAQNIAGKVRALTDLLQGSKNQQAEVSGFDKMEMINHGISKKEFEYLKQKSGLDYDQLSEVLSVARATLINKKGAEKFNYSLSEKIVSLADIYSYGYEVFEDEARFNAWVFRPNRALGGKAPYYFLNNQYGREEVKNLIGRIDYGVYA